MASEQTGTSGCSSDLEQLRKSQSDVHSDDRKSTIKRKYDNDDNDGSSGSDNSEPKSSLPKRKRHHRNHSREDKTRKKHKTKSKRNKRNSDGDRHLTHSRHGEKPHSKDKISETEEVPCLKSAKNHRSDVSSEDEEFKIEKINADKEGNVKNQKQKSNTSSSKTQKSSFKNEKKSPEMLLIEYEEYLKKEQNLHHFESIQKQDYSLDTADNFEYFYGSNGPFSQHYQCNFDLDGVQYSCAEQYMMHQKAVIFKDEHHAKLILGTSKPREMKKLGRKVQNFHPQVWNKESYEIVKHGNRAKFTQNEGLKAVLFSTYPRILVEASPRDKLWGIGLGRANTLAFSRRTWKGKNRLGYILTELRNEMMQAESLLHNKQK